MALTAYQAQVQRLLHDPQAAYYPTADLTAYINIARSQIAAESQSVRVLISGTIASVTVVTSGSGYATGSLVTPSGFGMGAVLTPTLNGGGFASVAVTAAGSGWDTTTTAAATDPTGAGSGATFSVSVQGVNNTVAGQEVYSFASRNTAAQLTSGANQILGVMSVSACWGGNMRPMLRRLTWTDFQAWLRSYSTGLQSFPSVWSQYGQGVNGSVYLYPIPSQALPMDWDTFCSVAALAQDTDPEAIPYPWTDAIPYYAAYLAYDNSQRKTDAGRMFSDYELFMKRARALSEPGFIPDPYSSD